MDDDLVFSPPSLQEAKKNKRGQHVKQAMINRSVGRFDESLSLSVFSRWGGAPQSVTPSNAPPFSLSLSSSRFSRPNLLEAVILLVQPSSAAVVDEHVQEHHRFLSLCLCLARTRQALLVSVLVFGRNWVRLISAQSSNPKMRRCWRCENGAGKSTGESTKKVQRLYHETNLGASHGRVSASGSFEPRTTEDGEAEAARTR